MSELNLERPAGIRRMQEIVHAVERDRIVRAIDLIGEEDAAVFLAALDTIRDAPHPPGWSSWDEASALYDVMAALR